MQQLRIFFITKHNLTILLSRNPEKYCYGNFFESHCETYFEHSIKQEQQLSKFYNNAQFSQSFMYSKAIVRSIMNTERSSTVKHFLNNA